MRNNRTEIIIPSKIDVNLSKKRKELEELGAIKESLLSEIKELQGIRSKISVGNDELDELNVKIKDVNKQLLMLNTEKETLSKNIKILEGTINELNEAKNQLTRINNDITEKTLIIKSMDNDIASKKEIIENNIKTINEQEKIIRENEETNEKNILDSKNLLKLLKEEYNTKRVAIDKELAVAERTLNDTMSKISAISIEEKLLQIEIDNHKKEALEIIANAKLEAENIINNATEQIEKINNQLVIRDGELSVKEKFLQERTNLLKDVKSQLEIKLGKTIDIMEF